MENEDERDPAENPEALSDLGVAKAAARQLALRGVDADDADEAEDLTEEADDRLQEVRLLCETSALRTQMLPKYILAIFEWTLKLHFQHSSTIRRVGI